ncbi:capsule biosynthesis protein [Pseudovibrio exalbescens]|uniref:Capsular biosynthesis protein n=1 Tax=Pseudovibrio exalbescens TaxID=197461 RepID=A0A1U7JEE8_9HYPH|nr:capsular biosynthesis protein [Pseudovibrio exalbescens]OKL43113.1 capsular biosynthesis protein [Pseudovibrio exalbescens]
MGDKQRVILFLQGPPSFFAREWADELERRGARTLRINLCIGDWVYWRGRRTVSYRGPLKNWRSYLENFLRQHSVTDVVYYQDRFPYHAIANEVCATLKIPCYAYEFGYLRPDWITLERDGMGAYSRFPEDPARIRELARQLPKADRSIEYPHPFFNEAFGEVFYHLANFFFPWPYLRFDSDKVYNPLVEYLAMIPRLLMARRKDESANMLIEDVIEVAAGYFVVPLQLQSDYQLRYNAGFDHLSEAIDQVMASFARTAPKAQHLVFKVHPFDNGIEPWTAIVRRLARTHGLKRRVHVIDGGNLVTLLKSARGAVMVNSTTGLHALRLGCPVKILGIAIYDIAGLTAQGSLDQFWQNPTPPDPELLADFEKVLAATIQIKGNFYTREGRRAATVTATDRLLSGTINQPGALEPVAPRLKRAAAQGIPLRAEDQIASRGRRTKEASGPSLGELEHEH